MCHSKQSLRILDKHGKLIWKNQTQLEGSMKFAVIPVKDSQTSRFYISTQHHHIEEKYFVLESSQR